MKKIKAFTFVELLLVMLVLSIIISLTLPLIKNIKDDDDIYRAYMKKANQDVTDAMNMIFIKNPRMTGMKMLANGTVHEWNADYYADSTGLRNLFNNGLSGETYDSGCITTAFSDGETPTAHDIKDSPCIVLGGKPAMLFKYVGDASPSVTDAAGEKIYGYVYIDVNRDKSPNVYCKDRYKFLIYNDRVAMESDSAKGGCSLEL